MALECEKTGAIVYYEWSGAFILTDIHKTSDGTIIFSHNREFQKNPRGLVNYKVRSWAKSWSIGEMVVTVVNPDQYVYLGYEGEVL